MPLQVAVTEPPEGALVGLVPRVVPEQPTTAVTVKLLLTARRVYPPLENRRSSYVPGASVAGIVKGKLPFAVPVVYRHARDASLGAPGAKIPIQSVAVGVQMPLQVAVTEPPVGALVGLVPRVVPEQPTTAVTVKLLLTARRVYPSLENRRSSYVPGASVARIVKGKLPFAVPVVYRHARDAPLGAPGAKSPIQSVAAGVQMPLQVAVTEPPVGTLVGLAPRVAPEQPATAVTVKLLLTARRVYPSLENRRSSYVPGASAAGIVKGTLPLAAPVV